MRIGFIAGVVIALLGAFVLTACGQAPAAGSATPAAQTVTVVVTDTGITASQTTMRPGVPCRFVVTNQGTVPHQFWLMPEGMAQQMGRMPMAQWHQHLLYSTQDIAPGRTATFDYTFTMPMMGQSLAFGCYAEGYPLMQLPIAVGP